MIYLLIHSKFAYKYNFLTFRYNGKLIDENEFSEALNGGFKNEEFRLLIIWLSNEISELGKLEEKVKFQIF